MLTTYSYRHKILRNLDIVVTWSLAVLSVVALVIAGNAV